MGFLSWLANGGLPGVCCSGVCCNFLGVIPPHKVWLKSCQWGNSTPGPSSLGAKWFRHRVPIHHPLGFYWYPLEGAGFYQFL